MSSKKDLETIAYCGLCCQDCQGYNGRIPDLARDLRKELRQSKYKKFADFMGQNPFGRKLKDYDTCYQVLGAMVKFRCRKGCRNGGGNPFCKVRACARKKGFEGCWLCEEFEDCKKLRGDLCEVHDDGHLKNLRRLKKKGVKAFLQGKRDW